VHALLVLVGHGVPSERWWTVVDVIDGVGANVPDEYQMRTRWVAKTDMFSHRRPSLRAASIQNGYGCAILVVQFRGERE
jgi:hypothetical protein